MLEFVFGWARIFFLETLPNNMWWCRCWLTIYFKGFLTPRLNSFPQVSSCGLWRVFSHSNSPSHRALGRYRHTSSSRQFHNILCWLEISNHCPDGGHGNVHCSSAFLKATSLNLWSSIIFCWNIRNIFFGFFSLWWMIMGIWALLLFIFLWNRKPWLDTFMFIITLECSKLWIWMGRHFRDILLIKTSRDANNCVQRVFDKNIYFIMIFPPILKSYYPMNFSIFVIFINKR